MPSKKVTALMSGVDTMSRGELVIELEKHSLSTSGKVSELRYTLRKWYEDHGEDDKLSDDDGPKKERTKTDAADDKTKPVHCSLGAACPDLYSMSHRVKLIHEGYRSVPILCRDGMRCMLLKDKDHLVKFAHNDDLSRVCPDGAECDLLWQMEHRKAYEHPGYRAAPFACRDGMTCSLLRDRGHLCKYAHEGKAEDLPEKKKAAAAAAIASSSGDDDSEESEPAPPPKKKTSPAKKTATTDADADDDTSDAKKKDSSKAKAKADLTLDDVPLDSAPESVLIPVVKDSEEFWDIEEKFAANLRDRNKDYVDRRIKAGKKPLRFILVGAERVMNPVLEQRFEIKKREIMNNRDAKDCRERVTFHGTHPENLKSILHYSLLPFKHPLNPCETQVDDGSFGTNKKGIYVSRYADYTLKYSTHVCSVDEGDVVETIMFRTLPGKSKHIPKLVGAIDPTKGFDSHSSPTFLEWYLFDEAQACPQYVLEVKAVQDTRTAADDE